MVGSLWKKEIVYTCSTCSKEVGVNTQAEFLRKMFEKKRGEIGDFFTFMI